MFSISEYMHSNSPRFRHEMLIKALIEGMVLLKEIRDDLKAIKQAKDNEDSYKYDLEDTYSIGKQSNYKGLKKKKGYGYSGKLRKSSQ